MKKNLNITVAIVILMLSLPGCIREDSIVFRGISDVEISMQGSPSLEAVLSVENTSQRNITIRDAAFTVSGRDGNRIGKVMVGGELSLPKRSVTQLCVPLKLSLDNPLRALAVVGDIDGNAPFLFISGSVTVKAGCIRKKFVFEKVPLSEFIRYFEGSELPARYKPHQEPVIAG